MLGILFVNALLHPGSNLLHILEMLNTHQMLFRFKRVCLIALHNFFLLATVSAFQIQFYAIQNVAWCYLLCQVVFEYSHVLLRYCFVGSFSACGCRMLVCWGCIESVGWRLGQVDGVLGLSCLWLMLLGGIPMELEWLIRIEKVYCSFEVFILKFDRDWEVGDGGFAFLWKTSSSILFLLRSILWSNEFWLVLILDIRNFQKLLHL